eukprot:scaffold15.g4341.t1
MRPPAGAARRCADVRCQALKFAKYQGLGNDFILVDNRHQAEPVLSPEQAAALCDRNFGVGGDGVIFALPARGDTDYSMRIYNSDGSEPEMCGNGIRCLARFVADVDGAQVRVDMGEPILKAADVPTMLRPTQVDELDLPRIGPLFEHHPAFPARTNTEFVEVLSPGHVRMVVWERGAGRTLACGTGACATVVAGVLEGRVDRNCQVDLPGGPLHIEWSEADNHIYMTGPAELVFEGSVAF